MFDATAATHGLPPCLWVPIAADSVDAIRIYVGVPMQTVVGRDGRINALCVQPSDRAVRKDPRVPLWQEPLAATYEERLYPARQVWVHVDYADYRQAYQQFPTPPIPPGYFLDHVQNREAIRLRGYSHPYLRLCPVSRRVNTSGGSDYGGEGMEKEYLRGLQGQPEEVRAPAAAALHRSRVVYADPMDITKMLDIPPGTGPLPGVRDTQRLLFPR
jgi:hypothetical protein